MLRNMEKVKDIVLFIIRSAIFLVIAKRVLIVPFVVLLSFILLFGYEILPFWLSSVLLLFIWLPYVLYMLSMYFTAKKLGIIKVLDSIPWYWLIVVLFVFEVVLTLSLPINLSNEPFSAYLAHEYKLIISNTFGEIRLGFGFIYTFIAYKTVKFLLNRFPDKLGWLRKFYPSKLEEIISFRNIRSILGKFCKNK